MPACIQCKTLWYHLGVAFGNPARSLLNNQHPLTTHLRLERYTVTPRLLNSPNLRPSSTSPHGKMASLSAESVAKPFLAKLGSGGERALACISAGFQALGRSATSKRGSTRAASPVGDANEPGFQCLQSTPVTPAKKVMIVNDGRCCEVCQAADTSIDPVNPAITRPFGSGVRSKTSGKWQERQCWYCSKVFGATQPELWGILYKQ